MAKTTERNGQSQEERNVEKIIWRGMARSSKSFPRPYYNASTEPTETNHSEDVGKDESEGRRERKGTAISCKKSKARTEKRKKPQLVSMPVGIGRDASQFPIDRQPRSGCSVVQLTVNGLCLSFFGPFKWAPFGFVSWWLHNAGSGGRGENREGKIPGEELKGLIKQDRKTIRSLEKERE
jgi:hypothetical protein